METHWIADDIAIMTNPRTQIRTPSSKQTQRIEMEI